jgi:signal peptidase I
MIDPGDAQTVAAGRLRRVSAVLLSLVVPGAGHFLLGAFRRGVARAVGLTIFGLLLLFAAPVSLLMVSVLIGVVVGIVGRVAAAIDTARIVRARPSWKIVIVAWAALLVGDRIVMDPLTTYYRAHYAQAFTIPSGAMQPTLLVGDYILVDKSAYRVRAPQRGDIVVFQYPQDERRDFIKRIIGTLGDIVVVRGRQVLVNGQMVVEPYVTADATTPAPTSTQPGYCGYAYACEPTRVPADSYFVMGDSRDNSQDSRYWGFVKREKIKGRAYLIYWSWEGDRHWVRIDRIGRSL